jgi:acyl-CoA thioesterase I
MSHCGANRVGIDRVEDVKRWDGIRRCQDLTQDFRGEARSAHAEQHDVSEAIPSYPVRECAQSPKLGCDDVERVEPAETSGDQLLNRGIGRPDFELFPPQGIDEAKLIEPRVGVLDRAGQWARLDGEGGHESDRNGEAILTSYNIMKAPVMTRVIPLALGLAMLVCAACTQPDVPPAEVRASSSSAAPARVTASTSRPRIVFLGDSLTAGYGLAKEESVPALIQARLRTQGYPYDVINAGVSGDTSAGGLSRLDWSLEGNVRILVIELGANDGLRGLPVANMKRNLTEVITRAQARSIKVVLTGMEAPPNFGAVYTDEFRQVYHDLAKLPGVTFMPFYLDGVAGIPHLNIADGIHPNAEGARIIEGAMWRTLEPLLEKADSAPLLEKVNSGSK